MQDKTKNDHKVFQTEIKCKKQKMKKKNTSDSVFNWSTSWWRREIFSTLLIDDSWREVRHSRSMRNSRSIPIARASFSAASAPRTLTLSSCPERASSIALYLMVLTAMIIGYVYVCVCVCVCVCVHIWLVN